MNLCHLAVVVPCMILGAALASKCTYPSPLSLSPFSQAKRVSLPKEAVPDYGGNGDANLVHLIRNMDLLEADLREGVLDESTQI